MQPRCTSRLPSSTVQTTPLRTQTKTSSPRPSQQYSVSALLTKLSTFNNRAFIITDQLHTLELLLRNVQQTSCPLPSHVTTTHQDAKPGNQDFTSSTPHAATSDFNWHTMHTRCATSTVNHPNSTIDPAAPQDRFFQLPPAMDTICATPTNDQSIHLMTTNDTTLNGAPGTTAIRTLTTFLNLADPLSHSQNVHNINDIHLPSTTHHMNTSSQATFKIVPNCLTFTSGVSNMQC